LSSFSTTGGDERGDESGDERGDESGDEAGDEAGVPSAKYASHFERWRGNVAYRPTWLDPARDLAHLNWASSLYPGDSRSGPVETLAWRSSRLHRGSLMLDNSRSDEACWI
jgi:hypothetical protein